MWTVASGCSSPGALPNTETYYPRKNKHADKQQEREKNKQTLLCSVCKYYLLSSPRNHITTPKPACEKSGSQPGGPGFAEGVHSSGLTMKQGHREPQSVTGTLGAACRPCSETCFYYEGGRRRQRAHPGGHWRGKRSRIY